MNNIKIERKTLDVETSNLPSGYDNDKTRLEIAKINGGSASLSEPQFTEAELKTPAGRIAITKALLATYRDAKGCGLLCDYWFKADRNGDTYKVTGSSSVTESAAKVVMDSSGNIQSFDKNSDFNSADSLFITLAKYSGWLKE